MSHPPLKNFPRNKLSSGLLLASVFATVSVGAAADLGSNLAIGAGSDGSSKSNGTSYGDVRDGNTSSYWQPSGTSGERVAIKWSGDQTFNTVVIREISNTVTGWRLVNHNNGAELASGSTLGASAEISFADVSSDKVNLYLDSASGNIRISEFEVYHATGASSSSSSSSSSSVSISSSSSPDNSSSSAPSSDTQLIQENQTGFCGVDGSVDSDNSGFTGSGFANTDNASDRSIYYSIEVPSIGTYQMNVRYANGASDRPAEVIVNGGTQGTLGMSSTGSWTSWAEAGDFSINLSAGYNTIELRANTSGGLANVDWLAITGSSPTAGDCNGGSSSSQSSSSSSSSEPSSSSSSSSSISSSSSSSAPSVSSVTLQENALGACLIEGTVDTNHSGYTGSGFANVDNSTGTGIEWDVEVPASGTYNLEWRYANGSDDRPAEVIVNYGSQGSLQMGSTGAWNSWMETSSFTVNLTEGENRIRLQGLESGSLANIDRLVVTGVAPQIGDCIDGNWGSGGSSSSSSSSSSSDSGIPNGDRTFYLSPNGNDSASGSESSPFASLDHVANMAQPGDVFVMRGGTYYHGDRIDVNRDGTSSKPITLIAYPGETPVFNFEAQAEQAGNDGIRLNADHWHIIGIQVTRAGGNGFRIHGSHNTIERCEAYANRLTGIHLEDGSYNLIKNNDSYRNFNIRKRVGNMSDGFAAKYEDLGPGNVFYGNRAWENSDDGFDFWMASNVIRVENNWSFNNGDASVFGNPDNYEGGGNGFKLGGDYVAGNHLVIGNMSFDNNQGNSAKGFDHNNNTGALTLINNTAYNNGRNYVIPNTPQNGGQHTFYNNLSLDGAVQIDSGATTAGNSWQSGSPSGNMFYSLDTSAARAPRQADGSLADINLLRPVPSSYLVDGGVEVGYDYSGSAPDIGALEYNP